MTYIGVEFIDHKQNRKRNFWALVSYERIDIELVNYDGGLIQEFDDWVEDGLNPEWTREEKQEYYKQCEWFWRPLVEEEIKQYKERSNKL